MESLKIDNNQNNEFSSTRVLAAILRRKWFVIITVILATAASVFISLMLPEWYKSTTNVVPPKKSDDATSISGGLSAVMKNVGLTKLGGSTSETYSYTVILTSRTVVDSMITLYKLDKVYGIPKSKQTELRTFFLENVDVTFEKDGNYLISIWDRNPKRAAEMANTYIQIANSVAIRLGRDEAQLQIEHISQRIGAMNENIAATNIRLGRFSKEYMMFAPEEQAKAMATAISEVKLQQLKYEMAYDLKKIEYGENDPATQDLKRLVTATKEKLLQAQTEPGFAGNFALNQSASVGVEFINLYAELETYTKMKAYLLPMLEEAKLDEVKNVRNLYVLDKAIPADKKDKPKRALIVGGTFLGSFILVVFILLLLDAITETKKKLKLNS
ncbi:MAG: Wzz/FepE/Etk N-terminal domain-containing protein [bacterium]